MRDEEFEENVDEGKKRKHRKKGKDAARQKKKDKKTGKQKKKEKRRLKSTVHYFFAVTSQAKMNMRRFCCLQLGCYL